MDIYEFIGYLASAIVAVSLAINSIALFRWVNMLGSIMFTTYGFLIDSLPVAFMNGLIVLINVYKLYGIYTQKDDFKSLKIRKDNELLLSFLDYHKKEIAKFFPNFSYQANDEKLCFFILRNMQVAGVFIGDHKEDEILEIELDYVVPQYRDYKNGKFVYSRLKNYFREKGIKKLFTYSENTKHRSYLKKVGFTPDENSVFVKNINT